MSALLFQHRTYLCRRCDVVEVAKFVEVLPVLKKAQAEAPTIEAVTALVSPQAAKTERVGFAVLGLVIKAIDDAGIAARANGLNVALNAQLVADIKSTASAVKGAAPLPRQGKATLPLGLF